MAMFLGVAGDERLVEVVFDFYSNRILGRCMTVRPTKDKGP